MGQPADDPRVTPQSHPLKELVDKRIDELEA